MFVCMPSGDNVAHGRALYCVVPIVQPSSSNTSYCSSQQLTQLPVWMVGGMSATVFQAWIVGGMEDVILAVIAIDHTGPRSSLGCESICRTSAVQQTGLPTSRTGEGNKCYVYLMSCSPTCILSGTTGTGPAQENGSANVIRARELQSTNISDVIPCGVYIPCVPCGTHRALMKLTTTYTPKVHPEA